MKKLNESNICICSIVRNAANGLNRNIPVINALCEIVKDFKLIVFENNSKDQTKKILRNWKREVGDNLILTMYDVEASVVIPSENDVISNPFFSQHRISKMAFLRNQYMTCLDQIGINFDYLIVVDLDVARLSLKGILSSFNFNRDWDAVIANGYSVSPKLCRRYHDTYALTLWGEQEQPQTERKIKELADKMGKMKKTDKWIRVVSGFGGFAIYRFEAVKGLRYQVLENDDKRVEVKCEHYSIYKQMIDRGYDRFYINPAMELKYQNLTFSIAWKSLKRRIKDVIKKMNKNI